MEHNLNKFYYWHLLLPVILRQYGICDDNCIGIHLQAIIKVQSDNILLIQLHSKTLGQAQKSSQHNTKADIKTKPAKENINI